MSFFLHTLMQSLLKIIVQFSLINFHILSGDPAPIAPVVPDRYRPISTLMQLQ